MERTEQPQVVIITGASGGMGSSATRTMAQKGYHIIMACCDLERAERVAAEIRNDVPQASIEVRELELSSRESIRRFAEGIDGLRIAALFNNAGTMNRYYNETADGLEHTMAVNYLGPFYLTRLLIPHIVEGGRIVTMVSLSTKLAHIDTSWPTWGKKKFSQLGSYASSKLALLYFGVALAQRHPEFYVNVADPGIVDTDIIRLHRWFDPITDLTFRPFIHTPAQGVAPAIAALETTEHMRYFVGKKAKSIPKSIVNSPLVEQLWKQSEEMLGLNPHMGI